MKYIQFLKDEQDKLSLGRLLTCGAFVVTSFIMAKLTVTGAMNEGYFSIYVGAFVANGLVSKGLDKKKANKE
jgi:hypothetical protein